MDHYSRQGIEADWDRRAAERRARQAANPAAYAEARRLREEHARKAREHSMAPAIRAAAERAEARSRGEAPAYEPSPADLAEMHARWTHEQIADVCRAIRMQRDMEEFKQAWNLAAQNVGLPLKMIAWPQWGRQ